MPIRAWYRAHTAGGGWRIAESAREGDPPAEPAVRGRKRRRPQGRRPMAPDPVLVRRVAVRRLEPTAEQRREALCFSASATSRWLAALRGELDRAASGPPERPHTARCQQSERSAPSSVRPLPPRLVDSASPWSGPAAEPAGPGVLPMSPIHAAPGRPTKGAIGSVSPASAPRHSSPPPAALTPVPPTENLRPWSAATAPCRPRPLAAVGIAVSMESPPGCCRTPYKPAKRGARGRGRQIFTLHASSLYILDGD
eukprot:TRINITY_DN18083_c0_g1_i1.p2 TRINITY_DN18083_c0_g1~~TRINITY_DN18083_c0_g1_i1.p2  ORF type:complete len:294 (+),score=27.64 TRINITY_DN18083_c0_g1_i1:123-884(+)